MSDRMFVRAKPGERCPMERNARQYIDDEHVVAVPRTSYYRMRLNDGSLVAAEKPEGPKPPATEKVEKKRGARAAGAANQ